MIVPLSDALAQNYILLPPIGPSPAASATSSAHKFLEDLRTAPAAHSLLEQNADGHPSIAEVIDTSDHGATLVHLSEKSLIELRAQQPGLVIVPEQFYHTQRLQYDISENQATATASTGKGSFELSVVDAKTGNPVSMAKIVAFTDFKLRKGVQGFTDSTGLVRLPTLASPATIEHLLVYPKTGYWSVSLKNIILTTGDKLIVQSISLKKHDARAHFYGDASDELGIGIRVGVVDTGVGPHPDIKLAGGYNCVLDADITDLSDADEHGTHVAGIIGARGTMPSGLRGMAPGVSLYAYRVFGVNIKEGASNFAIRKAIYKAIDDQCDLINMSLGGGPPDRAIERAITDAFMNGIVTLVATGNDGRQSVSFPASFSLSIGISAMGRRYTFPRGTADELDLLKPPKGADHRNFVAAFSNIGTDVDYIAPGVAILSTVPGGYTPMSGTSMACPIATGAVVRMLVENPSLLALPRDAGRSEAIIRQLATQANSLGFGATFEGNGLL